MKLRHIAALLMLLAIGCAKPSGSSSTSEKGTEPASTNSTVSTDPSASDPAATETTEVSFNVTGMK
jgi:hypothetical protein